MALRHERRSGKYSWQRTFRRDNPDVEIEVHYGGQPIYYYVISVE